MAAKTEYSAASKGPDIIGNLDSEVAEEYRVIISVVGRPGESRDLYINSNLPIDFNVNTSAAWGSPFGSGGLGNPAYQAAAAAAGQFGKQLTKEISRGRTKVTKDVVDSLSGSASNLTGGLANAYGANSEFQKFTFLAYDKPSHMDFNIQLVFIANTDVENDVMKPIRELLKLTCPDSDNAVGYMMPPGPHPLDDGGEVITVRIGKYMTISPIVIKSVNVVHKNLLEKGGNPIFAVVDVQFSTYRAVSKKDIDTFYGR